MQAEQEAAPGISFRGGRPGGVAACWFVRKIVSGKKKEAFNVTWGPNYNQWETGWDSLREQNLTKVELLSGPGAKGGDHLWVAERGPLQFLQSWDPRSHEEVG